MLAAERRSKLLEMVRNQGFASLPDMADWLQVSESTVRRDLAELEKEGAARRTHGGAFYTGPSPSLSHFRDRQEQQWDKKKAIAVRAAQLIDDGDTVLLDGGSTTYELARLLVGRPLQVVTSSLPVANLFSSARNVDLIVIGGYVHTRSGAIHGEYAERMLQWVRVSKSVISAAGINEGGLYNSNHMLATTQRAMLRAAESTILVADSSKFGHQSLAAICKLNEVQHAVVDQQLDALWRQTLDEAGVCVHLADLNVAREVVAGEVAASRDDGSSDVAQVGVE